MNVTSLIKGILGLRYFHTEKGDAAPVIPVRYRKGKVPLVVVVGPNAGGKSFVRRIVSMLCRKAKVECMAPSMELRSSSGMHHVFMYGDESWQSTGWLSCNSILGGIKTCKGRENPHVIYWDEPDIGLSNGYAAGAGRTIAAFARELPENTKAVFVVTHNKALVRQLVPLEPHYLHVGDPKGPPTLQAWLDAEEPIRAIEDLANIGHARFKRIRKIIDSVKS